MEHITIHVQVVPDFIVMHELKEKSYHGGSQKRHSYLLEHNICVIEELDSLGDKVRYSDAKYVACRIYSGNIQLLNEKHGWLNDNEATNIYIDEIADKALLGK